MESNSRAGLLPVLKTGGRLKALGIVPSALRQFVSEQYKNPVQLLVKTLVFAGYGDY